MINYVKELVPEFVIPGAAIVFASFPKDNVRVPAQVVIGVVSGGVLQESVSICNGSFSKDDLHKSSSTMEDIEKSRVGMKFDIVENTLMGFFKAVANIFDRLLEDQFMWIYSCNNSISLHRLIEQISSWTEYDLAKLHEMCIDFAGHLITGDVEKEEFYFTEDEMEARLKEVTKDEIDSRVFLIPVLSANLVYSRHVYDTYSAASNLKKEGDK